MFFGTYTSKKIDGAITVFTFNGMTIRTPRLVLTSVNQHEFDYLLPRFVSITSDPENVTWLGYGTVWGEDFTRGYLQDEIAQLNAGSRFGAFAVHHADTGEFMGSLNVEWSPDEFKSVGRGHANVAEIGYFLDKAFWGKGFGTEIAIAGKKYIKHILLHQEVSPLPSEIVATVHPENGGSKAILKKTLKRQEPEAFERYGGNPRLLFFKPLKQDPVAFEETVDTAALMKR